MKKNIVQMLPSAVVALKTLDRLEKEIRNAPTFEKLDMAARTAAAMQLAFKPVKEVSDRAGEIWIESEVRLAEELAKLPKAIGAAAGGKRSGLRGTIVEPRSDAPTRAELGVSKKRSATPFDVRRFPREFRIGASGIK